MITLVLGQLRAGKATGRDGIVIVMFKLYPLWFWQHSLGSATKCALYQANGVSVVVPLPKISTRDPLDPSQYRGITLVSVIYEAFCKIYRLVDVLVSENLIKTFNKTFNKEVKIEMASGKSYFLSCDKEIM